LCEWKKENPTWPSWDDSGALLGSALFDGPRLIHGFDNGIVANEIIELKQINPWCFICERGVEMGGE
jgi:hypothetical protein